jgi:hypothetical protein
LPKKKLLRKEFLTQIENLYTKLMGNNRILNLDSFLSSSCLIQLVASKVIRTEESGVIRTEESGVINTEEN